MSPANLFASQLADSIESILVSRRFHEGLCKPCTVNPIIYPKQGPPKEFPLDIFRRLDSMSVRRRAKLYEKPITLFGFFLSVCRAKLETKAPWVFGT